MELAIIYIRKRMGSDFSFEWELMKRKVRVKEDERRNY